MTDDYVFSRLSLDDTSYYAGTHRLVSDRPNYSATQQIIENDINASLDFDSTLAGLASPIDLQTFENAQLSVDIISDDFSQTTFTFNGAAQHLGDLSAPRRTDSGLSATAAPFIPATAAWSSNQYNFNVAPIPGQRSNRTLLTPINTNVQAAWQEQPYSAPSRATQAYPTAVSPSITLNDEPQWSHSAITGVQWSYHTPPAQAIEAWNRQQVGTHFQQPVYSDDCNAAYLTPTTPTYGGSALERSSSRASSAGTFICEHEGCSKEFKTRTDFTHHKRNHGERNHACSQCTKKFVFRKDLNRHMKTHNPEDRQFRCQFLDCIWAEKGFQRKDHYDRHLKTHNIRSGMLTPSGSAMSRSPSRHGYS